MSTLHDAELVLYKKLLKVAQAIGFIEKRGRNQHHQYDFVQAVDVPRDLREKLFAENIFVKSSAGDARHLAFGSKGAHLTTVDLSYRFVDLDSGAYIDVPWVGVGADTGGDKGIYKAYTGGLKYALMNTFLIPSTSDPETDQFTQQEDQGEPAAAAPAAPATHKDDARPAAPTIPLDRATGILAQAINVGHAKYDLDGSKGDPPVFTPVFKAKLALHGASKIGDLNVDTAEDVELWLRNEASAA